MLPKPVIDYTNKDYASLRDAMLALARYRLPEWTDQTPTDLGVLLVDLFAYMGDVVLYYQDRIANESFLHTATERRSVLHLLRLIGYELRPPVAATADLSLIFDAPGPGDPTVVVIPQGASFLTSEDTGPVQTFEYLEADFNIDLTSGQVQAEANGQLTYHGLPVRHSRLVNPETLGSATGEPNQRYKLQNTPVIPETLTVEVDEGAGWVQWDRRDSLLYHIGQDGRVLISGPEAREYYLQVDELGAIWVVFGDGMYGRRPPMGINNLRAVYRVGGGTVGNVPAGAINQPGPGGLPIVAVTNPRPAAGGAEEESVDHAVRFGPLAFRSGQRAVTLSDYVALAHQAGGVAKVKARSRGLNRVDLFIAPEGSTCRPVPNDLKKRLLAYFEDKRMAGTVVHIHDSICIPIDVTVDIVVARHHKPEIVRQRVQAAVQHLMAFEEVHFQQTMYLSKVYEAIEDLDGVEAVNVRRFVRKDQQNQDVQSILNQFGVAQASDLPEVIQRALQTDLAPEGRIEMGAFEIPEIGNLVVNVREVAS